MSRIGSISKRWSSGENVLGAGHMCAQVFREVPLTAWNFLVCVEMMLCHLNEALNIIKSQTNDSSHMSVLSFSVKKTRRSLG